MMGRRAILVLVALAFWGAGASSAWAQDPIHKVGRGVGNVLTGWLELPKQLHLGYQEPNPAAGIVWGIVKGVGMTVLRSGLGVYEVVTFPIPYPKDYASPYDHLEITDYAWE